MHSMLTIGHHRHDSAVIVAPMAGVTDQPFRNLCRSFGSNWLISEMVTSDVRLWNTRKSRRRLCQNDEAGPRWVQIAGAEPAMMAQAARMNVDRGAQIIDVNMGCPAKKVCNRLAGSSLLREPALVRSILEAVVGAVPVPVTLKMRLGWSRTSVNAVEIARIAEDAGVALVTIHGRTREDRFTGQVDYDTIGVVKQAVDIPVIGNGDITSATQAAELMRTYGLDGVMIGRAAQGRPWLPAMIDARLKGHDFRVPDQAGVVAILHDHVAALSAFYGVQTGVRVARKHVGWYLGEAGLSEDWRQTFNRLQTLDSQLEWLSRTGQELAA